MRHDDHEARHVPTFEGRPLARPREEVVDQGLGFDVVTLLGRRQVLRALGLGATTIGLAACGDPGGSGSGSSSASSSSAATSSAATSSAATSSAASSSAGAGDVASTEIPDETAGPYPGDGSNGPDVLEESGIVRSDIRSSIGAASGTAEGVPMELELVVQDLAAGTPFAGAAVYVWHCDREGRYSMYSDGVTDQNYLRGVQVADAEGRVRFTSIFPACYSGRWPHIHFEVYPDEGSITEDAAIVATSQVALPEDTCSAVYAEAGYESSVRTFSQVSLDSDGVFGDDGGASQLGTVAGDVSGGLLVSLAVGVDTTTTPSGGGFGGGGGGGGRPPGAP